MKQNILSFVSAFVIVLSFIGVANASECIDVYGLTVQGNIARANVRNNLDVNETIYYKLFVDGTIVSSSNTTIGPQEVKTLTLNYNFGEGEYYVVFKVIADCGSDEDYLIHLVSQPYSCINPYGVEGQGRCDYDERRYLICQNGNWVSETSDGLNYCNYCSTCGDGVCNCGETAYTCIEDCECEEGYLNECRYVDGWIQRKYVRWDCETEWINWKYVGYCCEDCYDCDCFDYDSCCVDGCPSCGITCSSEYLDVYRCNGNWLQRLYKNEDCTKTWHDWEYCEFGCSNKKCNPPCAVTIKDFDYTDKFFVEQEGMVTVVVENTGGKREIIEIELFVDGVKKGFYAKSVASGETLEKVFKYKTTEGRHRLTVIATSKCGRSDAKATYITVFSKQTGPGKEIQKPQKPPDEEEKTTKVDIFPTNLDISLQGSKVIVLDIETKTPQKFIVNVTGLPYDWVSYMNEKYIENEDFMYIYVTPRDYGSYTFNVKVTAEKENLVFESDIRFFVAAPREIEKGNFWSEVYSNISIMFTSFWFLLSITLTALAFVVLIGIYNLKYETIE